MPPELCRITSFNPDLDDWYSCHTSDDEAYQEALERNSVASFYTARGGGSTATSIIYASIAISSPARLADADQALAEMIPEPIGDQRQQHDPPELDEEDAPVLKRTRSSAPLQSAPSPPRLIATPSSRTKVVSKVSARRGHIFRAVTAPSPRASLTKGSQPAAVASGPLRICISVLPDNASVRVQFLSTIFCFGDVPLPLAFGNTDYATGLMGPEDGLVAEESFSINASPTHDYVEPPTLTAEPLATAKLDADCSVKLLTRPRGATPCKLDNPKDQNKMKSQADIKLRKKGSSFPGSLLRRLFSGIRSSRGGVAGSSSGEEGSLPPATVHELGSELLMASAATAVADLALATSVNPVLAGYVQGPVPAAAVATAAVPASTIPMNGALDISMLDEAAAAAQHLSSQIFRNVLRASADGLGSASTPKPLLNPRDTAFPSAEARTMLSDQLLIEPTAGTHVGLVAGADTHGDRSFPEIPLCQSDQSLDMSQQQLSFPGVAHALLADLAGIATKKEPAAPGSGDVSKSIPIEAAECVVAGSTADELAKVASVVTSGGKVTAAFSVDGLALDCVGLPMPELEQCESPIAVSTLAAGVAAVMKASTDTADVDEQDASHEHEITNVERPLAPADMSPATTSPRTVSKRAYGTVARLVKKIVPGFRDTAVMSSSALIQTSTVTASAEVIRAPDEGGVDQPLEQQSEGVANEVDNSSKAVHVDIGAAARMEGVPAPTEQPNGELVFGDTFSLAQDESAVEDTETEPVSKKQAKEPTGGDASVAPLFVFGQEQARNAKHGVSKVRSFTSHTAAVHQLPDDDLAQPVEAACRKRKAVDEILPNAKQPVFAERSSSNASEEDLDKSSSSELLTDSAKAQPVPTDPESPSGLQKSEAKDVNSSSTTYREVAVEQELFVESDGSAHALGAPTPTKAADKASTTAEPQAPATVTHKPPVIMPAPDTVGPEAQAAPVVEVLSTNCQENVPEPCVVAEDVIAPPIVDPVAEPSPIVPAAAIPAALAMESESQSEKPMLMEAVAAEGEDDDVLVPHAVSDKPIPAADGKEGQNSTRFVSVAAATVAPHSSGAEQTDVECIRSPAVSSFLAIPSTKSEARNVETQSEVPERIAGPQQGLAPASATAATQIMASPSVVTTSCGKEAAASQIPDEGDSEQKAGPVHVKSLANAAQDGLTDMTTQSEPEASANQQPVAHETQAAKATEPRQDYHKDAVAVAALPNTEIEAGMPEVPMSVSEIQAARDQTQAASGNATGHLVEVQSAKTGGKHKRRSNGFGSFFNCFKV